MKTLRKQRCLSLSVLLVGLCMIIALCGCAASPSLNKDVSLKTEWGAVLQYKISSDWDSTSPTSTKTLSMASYYDEKTHDYLSIAVKDASSSSYKFNNASTYDAWLRDSEKTHSGSQDVLGGDTYSNYSIDELNDIEIDSIKGRVYKREYTMHYTDEHYAKMKEANPELDRSQAYESTDYIALIKDGAHDLEIIASSEDLLKTFIDTLSIKW